MLHHFQMQADYNRWANAAIYDACAKLTDEEYRADTGAFFGSAHRTLNHILVADLMWMKRMTGAGTAPTRLDEILHDDFSQLRQARETEDERIFALTSSLTQEQLDGTITFTPVSIPEAITQRLAPTLAHVFNHQTHHRGQVHAILTSLGKPSVVLDMVAFLRKDGKRWM